MATESEQVRMLRENELLKAELEQAQVEVERLKAERDLARDQAASAAGDLEAYERATEQAQTRMTAMKDAITHVLHRRKSHGEIVSCLTLETALAAPAREGDADA